MIMNQLAGVEQTEPILDDRLNEIHGMVDNPVGSLHRVQGKASCIIGTTSTVWAIQQLRFREGSFTLRHDGPNLNAESWNRYRAGAVPFLEFEPLEDEEELPPRPIGGAVMFAEDVRQDDETLQDIIEEQGDTSDPDPRPTPFQYLRYNFDITETPDPVEINVDEGETTGDFTIGLTPLAGFGNIKLSWSDESWFSIKNVWSGGTISVENGRSISYGFFDETETFRAVVDEDNVPAGTTNISVTATATTISGTTIVDEDGDVTVTFTVQISAQAEPAITLTPTSDTLSAFLAQEGSGSSVINVKNTGGEGSTLNWTAAISGDTELTSILSLDTDSGSLAYNADEDVTATATYPIDIALGTYSATITFTDSEYGTVTAAFTLTLQVIPLYTGAISMKVYQIGDPPFSTTTSGPTNISPTLPNPEYNPYYSWGYVGFFNLRGGWDLANKRWYFRVVTSGATTESQHTVDGFDATTGCPVDFWTSGPGWGTLGREITLDTPT